LAYAIGLITTDGNLSNDGRHIILVSKDIEQLQNFAGCLKLKNKISTHSSTYNPLGEYYHIQFGSVKLYRFLTSIGLMPNKSKIIGKLDIPIIYFADFLRGHLDGDGNISIVSHPESKYLQLRLRFLSASLLHLEWLKTCIKEYFEIDGGFIDKSSSARVYRLVYCKADSTKLMEFMYYDGVKYYLKRKFDYYKDKGEWRNGRRLRFRAV
jgi:hypothetical protein